MFKLRTGRWLGLTAIVLICGCAQEMMNQPRIESQEQPSRRLPEYTVPTSYVARSEGYQTGMSGGIHLERVPDEILAGRNYRDLLLRGQQRFNINCAPCHGRLGNGLGMVARSGLKFPPSYHIKRLREQPIGYIFSVASNGRGEMPAYVDSISTEDRWAIAAYVQALQLSQHVDVDDLPPSDRERLK